MKNYSNSLHKQPKISIQTLNLILAIINQFIHIIISNSSSNISSSYSRSNSSYSRSSSRSSSNYSSSRSSSNSSSKIRVFFLTKDLNIQ